MTYERITSRTEDGKRQTYRVRIVQENDEILVGELLDKDWNIGGKFGKNENGEDAEIFTSWIVEKSLITKRVPMRENRTYGTWEPISEQRS